MTAQICTNPWDLQLCILYKLGLNALIVALVIGVVCEMAPQQRSDQAVSAE